MDFVRLDANSYLPIEPLIEGYNSLIWTERFQEPGEFELKSFDILGLSMLLPEDTLVTHLDTREVMMVETHEINMVGEGADAQPELTVRGRTASTILEHRWIESAYQKKRRMRKKYSATTALLVLLVNAVDNTSGYDLTRGDDEPDTKEELNNYPWTKDEALPNIAVTETVPAEGEARWWQLEQGILWPQFQTMMVDADLGLRLIRPVSQLTPGTVITVKSNLADRGTIVRTPSTDIRALQFNVYQGANRTSGDGAVQLSLLQGHIDKPTYLHSKKDYKTVLEVMSGAVEVRDVTRPGENAGTGWKRRTMGFDAGSPDVPKEPEKPDELKANATKAQREARAKAMDKWIDEHAKWKNKNARIVGDFKEEVAKAGQRELKKARRVDMFAGDISTLSPYVYKTHYNLGDTVMLYGDYGKSAPMIVSEYVRTEDINGDRGFPGLVAP